MRVTPKDIAIGGLAVVAIGSAAIGLRKASMAPIETEPSSLRLMLGDRARDLVATDHHRPEIAQIIEEKVQEKRAAEEALFRTTTFRGVQSVKLVGEIFTNGTSFSQPSKEERQGKIEAIKRVGAQYTSDWADTDWRVSRGKVADIFDLKHEDVIYTVTVDRRDSDGLIKLAGLKPGEVKDITITLDRYKIGSPGDPFYASDVVTKITGSMDYRFGDGRFAPDDVLHADRVTLLYQQLKFVQKRD